MTFISQQTANDAELEYGFWEHCALFLPGLTNGHGLDEFKRYIWDHYRMMCGA